MVPSQPLGFLAIYVLGSYGFKVSDITGCVGIERG